VFVALLDTNVLWPSLQRDFLLSLAVEDMFRPVWSSEILAELEYEEARNLVARHGLDPSDARSQLRAWSRRCGRPSTTPR
jgi:hypothetical protein